MPKQHLIDTAVFDIGFDDEETALQAQSELESFCKRQIMNVIDEVFGRASEAGYVMRIPSLELDLGSVAYRDYQDELPRRLRDRLTALLAELRGGVTGRSASNRGVIGERQAEYAQLEYFLLTGHLPWYSSLDDEVDLEGLLGLALSENALGLKKFLQTTPHRDQVVTRLVNQFPLPAIIQLFHLLAPVHEPLIHELMHSLSLVWNENDTILNKIGMGREEVLRQLWRQLIQLVLGQDGQQYNTQELIARALGLLLFAKHKINRKDLTIFIAQLQQAAPTPLSTLDAVMQQLMQKQAEPVQRLDKAVRYQHKNGQSVDAASSDHAGLQDMTEVFKAAIESGDHRVIEPLWETLLSEHAVSLERMLRRYGQRAEFRKKLAFGLTLRQLDDILELIEPREHAFVKSVIEQHEPLRPHKGSQLPGKDHTIRQLWEFSLGYILVERGSRFNKQTYLASLLRQMAASENMLFQDLLQNLLEHLDDNFSKTTYGSQIRHLLLELREEQGSAIKQTSESPPGRELREYLLYEQLRAALANGIAGLDGGESRLLEIIDEIQRDFPWQLLRILRELQAFTVNWSSTSKRPTDPLLRIMQQLMQEQAEPVQWLDKAVRDQHENGQSVDAACSDHAGLHDMAGVFKTAIEAGDNRVIEPLWETLLSEHAVSLERMLRRYGQQAEFRKKLAFGLTHRQLHDILELIEPREHAFLTSVIEQHEPLRSHKESGPQGKDHTIRQLWEFSLGYILMERGSRFNKKSYLASLLRQMAASENMQFQDLLQNLLEHLDDDFSKTAYGSQICHLLLELREARETRTAEAKAATSHARRAYALYGLLHQALLDGRAVTGAGEASLAKVIDELRHGYPEQLMQILRELQFGAISWSLAHSGFSTVLLRQLMLAFLDVTSQSSSGSRPELHDAVIANAERSMNQNQYYRRLLDCMIQGELIDFEAIIDRTDGDIRESVDSKVDDEVDMPAKQPALPEITDDQVEVRLRQFLKGEIELSPAQARSLIQGIMRRFEQQPQRFLQLFVIQNANEQQMARLVALLPDGLLAGMVSRLAGQSLQRMFQCAELMTTACLGSLIGVTPAQLRQLKWEYIFAYLAGTGRLFNEQGFILGYIESLIGQTQQQDPQQFRALFCQQLVVNMLPSTRDASHRVVKVLSIPVGERAAQPIDNAVLRDEVVPSEAEEPAALAEAYVSNAGLVLVAPYLPRLFELLGLMEKSAFKDREAGLRAVQLLQYLVNERSDIPEYQLFLNKLLCGVKTDESVPREIVLTEQEKERLEGLLQGMIQNWKALGNTSVAGLREAFLQRQGRLHLKAEAWHLRVESKAYDMLLDQLPWSFSIIKHPWMERVIHVEWR